MNYELCITHYELRIESVVRFLITNYEFRIEFRIPNSAFLIPNS